MFFSLSSTTRMSSPAIYIDPTGSVNTKVLPAPTSLHPDPAAVKLDQPLGEREPEAGTFRPIIGADARLLELLEDPLAVLEGDPRPCVRDRDPHLSVRASGRDPDVAALRGELDRDREQVEDHLPDPALVALDEVDPGVGIELELDLVLQRTLSHHDDPALERLAEGECPELELDLSCLDLGQVEDVVDQREQVMGG